MIRLGIRPLARGDIASISAYLLREAGSQVALEFGTALERAFQRITIHPCIGAIVSARVVQLWGLRNWPIPGFERYLILYLPVPESLDVLRVVHSARDIEAVIHPFIHDA